MNKNKNILNTIILVLSIAGVTVSAYIWSLHLRLQEFPDCTFSGCKVVLTSEWSLLFGIPVAAWGFFFYAILSVLVFQRYFVIHKAQELILMATIIVGLLFTVYLRYIEITKTKEWCQLCWISVLLLLGITIAYIIDLRGRRKTKKILQTAM